jgi:ligand-binding sensor domain-containing protein
VICPIHRRRLSVDNKQDQKRFDMKKSISKIFLLFFLFPAFVLGRAYEWRNLLDGNKVNGVALEDGYMWVATDGGLVKIDQTTGTPEFFNKANSGLPSNVITAVTTDASGNKWIGTKKGLVRYDGAKWTVYDSAHSGLPLDYITCIVVDSNGHHWIGTFGGGLSDFFGAEWTTFTSSNSGLSSNYITSITLDPTGGKWIGTEYGGLAYFSAAGWQIYDTRSSQIPENSVRGVAIDGLNRKWIATASKGLVRFSGQVWTNYTITNSAIASNTVLDVKTDAANFVWCATDNGISVFDGTRRWNNYNTVTSGVNTNNIRCVTIDDTDTKWFGTEKGVARYTAPDSWALYVTSETGMPGNEVKAFVRDAEGHIWIGTNSGLAFYNGDTWVSYTTSNSNLPSNQIRALAINSSGVLWIGTAFNGIASFDPHASLDLQWHVYDMENSGLPDNSIQALAVDGSDHVWAGTNYGGVAYLAGTQWAVYNFQNTAGGLPDNGVRAITIDIDGNIWFGTNYGGLTRFDGKEWQVYNSAAGLPDPTVTSIAIDRDGSLWLGTLYNGVMHLKNDKFSSYNIGNSGLLSNYVTCLAIDSDGNKWVGTTNGIAKYNDSDWTAMTALDSGLPENFINCLILDNDSILWVGTDAGIGLYGDFYSIFAPRVSLSANSLDFGSVLFGNASNRQVIISNAGRSDLIVSQIQITGIDPTEYAIVSGGTPVTLAPSETQEIQLRFAPANSGTRTATLSIVSNAPSSPDNVSLTGFCQAPLLHVSKTDLSFGTVWVGQTSNQLLTLSNRGLADLAVTSISVSGPFAANFAMDTTTFRLDPGAQKTVMIVFSPDQIANFTAFLNIQSNGGEAVVNLSGTGTSAIMNVPSTTLNFFNVRVGTTAVDTLRISNTGTAALVVDSVYLSGSQASSFSANTSPFTLTPGSSLVLIVHFTPNQVGSFNAFLNFASNIGLQTITLTGIGIAPKIAVDPTAIDFGIVMSGITKQDTITISNIGTAELDINELTISGTHAAQFNMDAIITPFSIEPGGAQKIVIFFTPNGLGPFNATLSIKNTYRDVDVALTGVGLAPVISVSPDTLDFGYVEIGKTLTDTITVRNTGTAELLIAGSALTGSDTALFSVVSQEFMLMPEEEHDILVEFSPINVGEYTADLNLNTTLGTVTIRLHGFGAAPAIAMSPDTLQFGRIEIGRTAVETVQVSNVGTAILYISSSVLSGAGVEHFSVPSQTFSLLPGNSHPVQVRFSPHAVGVVLAFLDLNTSVGVARVTLRGTGFPPVITILPDTLDFFNVDVGTAVTDTIRIINTSLLPLDISGSTVSGVNAENFFVPEQSFVLAPDSSQNIYVQFNPNVLGRFTAELALTSAYGIILLPLRGTGVAPGISIDKLTLDFGDVGVGYNRSDSLSITNTGTSDLHIVPVGFDGSDASQFYVNPELVVIHPETKFNLVVEFTPTQDGPISSILTLSSNVYNIAITVHGTGIKPAISFSKAPLNFGAIALGESLESAVTLTNATVGFLRINNAAISGSNAEDFSLQTVVDGLGIPPEGSTRVTCRFTPLGEGDRNAYLVFQSNSKNNPDTLALKGKGMRLALTINYEEAKPNVPLPLIITYPVDFHPTLGALYYRMGGQREYQRMDLDATGEAVFTNIPTEYVTIRGVEYYVSLSDGVDNVYFPLLEPAAHPASIPVAIERMQAPISVPESRYKMISVPMYLADSTVLKVLFDDYGEYNKQLWRLFSYSIEVPSRYLEYPLFEKSFEPGAAFWLINRSGKTFDVENATSTPTDQPFEIVLQSGWNQIGNPFAFPVRWTDVNKSELIEPPVFFNGSDYEYEITTLNSWDGYFVHNRDTSPLPISIPPVEAPEIVNKQSSRLMLDSQTEYMLQLSAKAVGLDLVDDHNYIGLLRDASEGYDERDFAEAPPIGDFIQLSLVEDDVRFAGNFKPLTNAGYEWSCEVTTSLPIDATITVRLQESGRLPDGLKLYILDNDDKSPIVPSGGQFSIQVRDEKPVRHLALLLATEEYATAHSNGIPLMPLTYGLDQNYPNPFNPETTITYRLKKDNQVILCVYNLLGQKVRTLVDEQQSAGEHSIRWDGLTGDGAPAADGLYIYRIHAGDYIAARKMLLVH